jgi:hypothetical protein
VFKLSQAQVALFEQDSLRQFEQRALQFVRQTFSRHWRYLGEAQVLEVIHHGLERAHRHHLTLESSVLPYLSVMFMLGSGFDADPQYPWAKELLTAPHLPAENARARRLQEQALDYAHHALKDFRGAHQEVEKGRFAGEMLRIFREGSAPLVPESVPDFTHRMLLRLNRAFPHKCAYLGESTLRQVVQQGIDRAAEQGLRTERGTTVFTLMQFVLGSGFVEDPLVPWAAPLFEELQKMNPSLRADKLYEEALSQLKSWSRLE